MKNKVLYLVSLAILGVSSVKAQLNVGSTSAADASAILQATSTTKGFLPPVMTTTQINAIALPANGLTVYNSTLSQLQVNVGTPAAPSWSVAAGGANVYWSQAGNTGSVPGTNYIGTTDNASIGFRTNGVERVRIDSSTGYVGIGITTPHASLQFSNNLTNRKIVLKDSGANAANDSAFYGLGTVAGGLRYQVPAGSNHSFYNNKSLVANINSFGQIDVYGSGSALFFADRTRLNNRGAIYASGGYLRLWGSQNGDVLTVDSIGNTAVGGNIYTSGKITMGNNGLTTIVIGNGNSPVTTGTYNQVVGILAGQLTTTGTQNTFSGYQSGNNTTTGSYNDFTGLRSGSNNTTGSTNTFHGYQSGGANTTGSDNTGLGINAGPGSAALVNSTAIGANTYAGASNTVILGNNAFVGIGTGTPATKLQVISADNAGGTNILDVEANNQVVGVGIWYNGIRSTGTNTNNDLFMDTKGTGNVYINTNGGTGNVGIGTTSVGYRLTVIGTIGSSGNMNAPAFTVTSDRRLKKNFVPVTSALGKVMQLVPYSYDKKSSLASTNYDQKEMGFIAQDVRKVFPELVTVGKDADKLLAINYTALIPLLTKAIQEQQAKNDTQVAQIAVLTKANTSMAAQLADLKDMKIAMAAMQTELSKIALVNKIAASNTASK